MTKVSYPDKRESWNFYFCELNYFALLAKRLHNIGNRLNGLLLLMLLSKEFVDIVGLLFHNDQRIGLKKHGKQC
jgi:hypothetical protein